MAQDQFYEAFIDSQNSRNPNTAATIEPSRQLTDQLPARFDLVNHNRSIPLHFSNEKLLMKRDLPMNIKVLNTRPNKLDDQWLTWRDIENLLLAYSGAVALDQIRVDRLPP